ncbi:NfeD family protein [bacterium]|jgi:membrane protein implicated in regulation of membrane protease activity|nr:NfeD family protein [bacterium]
MILDLILAANFSADAAVSTAMNVLTLYRPHLWFVAGLAFFAFELFTPGQFFFVAIGIGAMLTSLLALWAGNVVTQCTFALVASFISFIMIRRALVRNQFSSSDSGESKSNFEALVGETGAVEERISLSSPGLVKVRGELWSALPIDDRSYEKNTIVVVVEVSGNRVLVKTK